MKLLINGFFLVLISSGLCLSGTIDPDVQDRDYTEYGKTFQCVGHLCGKDKSNQYFCASAVAIKPRWILTAAHVVNETKQCHLSINNKKIQIEKIIVHQNFNYDNFGEYDIALCRCVDDIGLKEYPLLYLEKDEVGKQCSISGYGLHGNFISGCKEFDGKKRAGFNFIDGYEKQVLICSPSRGEEKTNLEFMIGSGDSGGGLFIDNKLAGINSCVVATDKAPDSSYGDEGYHTRVSLFSQWIEDTVCKNKK